MIVTSEFSIELTILRRSRLSTNAASVQTIVASTTNKGNIIQRGLRRQAEKARASGDKSAARHLMQRQQLHYGGIIRVS